ncbi:MAG TPA: hypothetical protein VG365_05290 [Solirubrobacteraceae bacterium]|nr:hypothetical protein [Solirubrobacteraceae bacterium]
MRKHAQPLAIDLLGIRLPGARADTPTASTASTSSARRIGDRRPRARPWRSGAGSPGSVAGDRTSEVVAEDDPAADFIASYSR